MGLIGDKFKTLSRWWRKNELKNFSLIFLSALSAHLFAVTTFKMYLHYFTRGWDGGNQTDLWSADPSCGVRG